MDVEARLGQPGATVVPILLYHRVTTTASALIQPFTVTPAVFREHLDCVVALGFTSLTVSGFLDAARGSAPLPSRPIVITFDDGYTDFYDVALPALRERGLTSTMYLTTGFLRDGREPPPARRFEDPMLSWSQLQELRQQGVELGGHSHTHPHLDTLSRTAARDEVTRCKALVEDELGEPVATFAYPNGYSSAAVRRLVREAGYHGACSVKEALSSTADDPFSLARLMVHSDTSASDLRDWITGAARAPAPKRERLRTRGWRLYRRARAIATRTPGSDLR
jgi:peptidoglycan/xylan/chitin deacetylase (PgdA/CDA1 family)